MNRKEISKQDLQEMIEDGKSMGYIEHSEDRPDYPLGKCPVCGSEDITYGDLDWETGKYANGDNNGCWGYYCICNNEDCNGTWEVMYLLQYCEHRITS